MPASSGCAAERALSVLSDSSRLSLPRFPLVLLLFIRIVHCRFRVPVATCIASHPNSSSASSHHRTLASIHITTYYTFKLYIPRSLFHASHRVWSTHTHCAPVVFLAFLSHTYSLLVCRHLLLRSDTITFSFAGLLGSERSSETPIVLSAICVQCSPSERLKLEKAPLG